MSEEVQNKPELSFWVIAGAALVWNLLGLMIYIMQVTASPDAIADVYSPEEAEFILNIPAWATGAYALAVTAGSLASAFLLFRKALAIPLYILSLAGVLVQNVHGFILANGLEVFGPTAVILPAAVIIIGIALIFYSRNAKAKGLIS